MFSELIHHSVNKGSWNEWDGTSIPCVRVANLADLIGHMRRQAWTAAAQYWESCDLVPPRFRGTITVDSVDQYLLGLNIGMDVDILKASR